MVPYFLLLIIPLLFQFDQKRRIKLKNRSVRVAELALPLFFVLYLLLLALRYQYLGRDLSNYEMIFYRNGNTDFKSIFDELREFIFRLYCWSFYNFISEDYQLFISFTAIISVFPLMYVYCKDKSQGFLKASIFVNMSTFIMLFSGIRQGLAFCVGILAYQALVDKKYVRFGLLAFITMFIHHTGFMILFLLPLYFLRLRKRDLLWIVPAAALVIIFNQQIFNFLSNFIFELTDDDTYLSVAGETGAILSFALFALFAVFSYVVEDEKKMDKEAFFLRNILLFAVVLQSFASLNSWAMRMNYYFVILVPIAVGKSISFAKPNMLQVAKIGKLAMCVFFTAYFLVNVYTASKTGISALDNYPYRFFWEG